MVDLDGTLVNTIRVNYFAYKKALSEFNYQLSYEEYKNDCDGLTYKIFLKNMNIPKEHIEKIHENKKKYYKEFLHYAELNTRLVRILESLKKSGNKLALVTCASAENTQDVLRMFGLNNSFFDMIVTRENVISPKPSPEGFLLVMETLNFLPEDCIVFEDTAVGIHAASEAKCMCFEIKNFIK